VGVVLIIGARGVLGSLVADAFERSGWDVRRGSRHATEDPGWRLLDLDRPDTIAPALDGVDVAVTVVPHPEMPAERYVLEQGGRLLSVVAVSAEEARPLRALGPRARGTVLLNAGLMPGVTNLVAADLLRAHPDADGVELVLTASASGTLGRAGGEFVYANLRTRRRHRTAAIPLPAPYGTRRCLEFAEGSGGWLGDLADGRDVRAYLCLAQRVRHDGLLAANALGACRALPRAQFVAEHPPGRRGASRDAVAEWVAVTAAGRRVAAAAVECEGDYRATAEVAVVFAERMRSDAPAAGCFDPHELLAYDELAPRLAERGVRVVPQPID
jgi:hypothetical protein